MTKNPDDKTHRKIAFTMGAVWFGCVTAAIVWVLKVTEEKKGKIR